jgi:hypothetical protein
MALRPSGCLFLAEIAIFAAVSATDRLLARSRITTLLPHRHCYLISRENCTCSLHGLFAHDASTIPPGTTLPTTKSGTPFVKFATSAINRPISSLFSFALCHPSSVAKRTAMMNA